ncbi:hypothetical protein RUND412_008787 [Rhizina undulata]
MLGTNTISNSAVESNNNTITDSGNTNTTNYGTINIYRIPTPNASNIALGEGLDITPVNSQDFKRVAGASTGFSASNTMFSPFRDFNVGLQLPFQRNHDFCGRDDILERLHHILEPQDLAEPPAHASERSGDVRTKYERKTVILYGLGGSGKSQIALEYAHRFSHCYTSVFWIDADDSSRTVDSACKIVERLVRHYTIKGRTPPDYHEIATFLGIQGSIDLSGKLNENVIKTAMEAVDNWLSATENRRWLLLIDNNDKTTVSELAKLLPTCEWGSVIVTTRSPNLRKAGECIEVEGIGAEAGLELLLKSSGKPKQDLDDSEIGEAQKIVKALGQLPLALDQTGAYIYRLQKSFSIYQKELDKGIKNGFNKKLDVPSLSRYRASVLTTWEISFQELPINARQLLHLCAFLSNEDIPEELFRRGKHAVHWIKADEKNLENAIDSLFSFSLAKRKESGDSFYIHPLVHAWARERLNPTTRRQTAIHIIRLVSSAISNNESWWTGGRNSSKIFNNENIHYSENSIFQRRILSHLNLCREHLLEYSSGWHRMNAFPWVNGLRIIGCAFWNLGYFKQAEELFQRLLEYREKDFEMLLVGSSSPSPVMGLMAGVVHDQGRYDEAIEWYRKALTGYEKSIWISKGHSAKIKILHNMALVFDSQGRYDEALEFNQRALAGLEKSLGKDDLSTLATVNNMASVYNSQGRYNDALELYQRVLAGREKALGKEHHSTLTTVDNMGTVFNNKGLFDKALELHGRALAGIEKKLGKDHLLTLTTVHNMASVFKNQGRYDEALELFRRVLEGREKILGKEHPLTLKTVDCMANIMENQGRHGES